MDLQTQNTEILSNEGARMEILQAGTDDTLTHRKDGYDEAQPMFLQLMGPDSTKTQQEIAKVRNRAAKRRGEKNFIPSKETLEDERVKDSKMLAGLCVGGEVFLNDKWSEVDEELAYAIFYEFSSVRIQALGFIMDRENFTKG